MYTLLILFFCFLCSLKKMKMLLCVLGLLVCALLRNTVVLFCWFVLSVGPLSTSCCALICFICVAALVLLLCVVRWSCI